MYLVVVGTYGSTDVVRASLLARVRACLSYPLSKNLGLRLAK